MRKGGRADYREGLIHLSRWVTPTNVPKRFTTQIVLYFLPIIINITLGIVSQEDSEVQDPTTTDGGLERTTARFPASVWLQVSTEVESSCFRRSSSCFIPK